MAVQVKPWQMKDADGNLLSPNTYTNTIYDPDGNLITNIATEREIGNAYDSSKTYPTYSPYCIHNNKFYKYSGASGTTTTGDWDSTKWTETPIANELSLLNSNLTELSPYIPVDTSTLVKTFSSNDSFTVATSGWYLFTTTCPSATDSVRLKFGTYVYITTSSPLLVPIKAGTVISALATSTYNIKMALIT